MANSALIEDLRKQFAENPRRVFARLANEYRKSGDLDVAIEICRAHVPLQPTYISGYIVLGQALFERGQPDEARSTFETALTLDPENLIALRQLGDIARTSGDLDAARGWYHKLLEVDPQNDEITAQLEALDAPAHTTSAPTPAAPAAASRAEAPPVSWNDIHPDSNEVVTPLSPQATQPTRPRFTIGVIPENVAATEAPVSAAKAETSASEQASEQASEKASEQEHESAGTLPESFGGFDRHSPTPPAPSDAVLDFSSAGEVTFDASEMTADSAEASVPELMDISDLAPVEFEHSEHESSEHESPEHEPIEPEPASAELPPLATTAEFSVPAMPSAPSAPRQPAAPPATAAELAKLFAGPELETARPSDAEGAEEPSSVAAESSIDNGRTFEEEPYDPTIGRMLDLSNRTSSDALLPDLMMTESGAELLREQGHIDQAIYVYRHLAAKNPDDTSYAERIAALERGAHSSIPLIASISEEFITAAKNRPYSTQSIRTFFTSFAMRRPPETAEGENEPVSQTEEPAAQSEPEVQAAAPAPAPAAPAAPEPPEIMSAEDRSALETLFSGKPKVAASDERAAAALASAFSEGFTPDANGPAGQPTRAASDALSLDAVFQTTRSRTDGEHRASQPAVSFDEFFANRENGNGAAEGKNDSAVETASHGDDSQSDLELFHEWLDGLKK